MKRAIHLFPNFSNIDRIEAFREKYDPLYNLIPPHLTLVFPFENGPTTKELRRHVERSVAFVSAFRIVLQEITGEQDRYLFLNVKEGNDKIVELHDRLYRNVMAPYINRRITYVPHLTMARFSERNKDQFEAAFRESLELSDRFESTITDVYIEQIAASGASIIETIVPLREG